MHEYIEIQFRRKNKPFPIKRQVAGGFVFDEPDPPARSIDVGFSPFDDGTKYRMMHIRQVKGWNPQEFRLRISAEDGSLVLRGDDEYSLPEGFYNVTANVDSARVKKRPKRVEVKHDSHGVVVVELELDERTIDISGRPADSRHCSGSILKTRPALWMNDDDVRPTRRACALNLLTCGCFRASQTAHHRSRASSTPATNRRSLAGILRPGGEALGGSISCPGRPAAR